MRARRKGAYGTAPSYHLLGTVKDNSQEGLGSVTVGEMDCEKERIYIFTVRGLSFLCALRPLCVLCVKSLSAP